MYQIRCRGNDGVYIGASVNIESRIRVHKHLLRKGAHPNNYLQNAWAKYGETSFCFEQILSCEKEFLDVIEYQTISDFVMNGVLIFNSLLDADSGRAKGSAIASWTDKSIENRKAALVELFKNPENRKKAGERTRRWASSDANRERVSAQMKEQWLDPDVKAKRIATLKKSAEREEFKARISEASRSNWSRPEYRALISEKRKAFWADPANREKMLAAKSKSR